MTLVISRILPDGGVRIDSDSKITDPKIVSNRNNIFSGLLKTIILNPKISVSYAGGVETAQKAIDSLYELSLFEINQVKSKLLKIHIESDLDTDFLIASIERQPMLYKIANGKVDISNSIQWIGDIEGFKLFQKEFLTTLKSYDPKHIYETQSKAFEKVITDGKIESIGGFQITVHRTKFGFEYLLKMSITSGQPIAVKSSKHIVPFGNAKTGSYSYSYLVSSNPFYPAIGIHFAMGNFGMLYYPKNGRNIIMYRNVNGFEFAKKVSTEFGIKLTGLVKDGDRIKMI